MSTDMHDKIANTRRMHFVAYNFRRYFCWILLSFFLMMVFYGLSTYYENDWLIAPAILCFFVACFFGFKMKECPHCKSIIWARYKYYRVSNPKCSYCGKDLIFPVYDGKVVDDWSYDDIKEGSK